MTDKLKNIEATLNNLTTNHTPELSSSYMDASGQKLRNGDKNTNDIILFTEETATEIYNFMRATIGKSPFIVE